MKVKVSLDNVSYRKKTPGCEIPRIKKRTIEYWQEIELEELADLNGNKGHAAVPGHLVGGMAAANCVAMQLLALDFDEGCTFAQIKRQCENIGLRISYAYHTLSSSPEQEAARIALVQLLHPLMEALDVGKHFAEYMRRFASDAGISLTGKHLPMGAVKDMDAILGEYMDSAVIHKTGGSTKSPF